MISISIPGAPPLLLNSRLHWRTIHSERTRWKKRVEGVVYEMVRKPDWVPIEAAKIAYHRFCGNVEPDHDNLVSGFKWIQDALVEQRVLTNDRTTNIVPSYHWAKASRLSKRILIEITPLPSSS